MSPRLPNSCNCFLLVCSWSEKLYFPPLFDSRSSSGSENGEIVIYNVAETRKEKVLKSDSQTIHVVAVRPIQEWIPEVASSSLEDSRIHIWRPKFEVKGRGYLVPVNCRLVRTQIQRYSLNCIPDFQSEPPTWTRTLVTMLRFLLASLILLPSSVSSKVRISSSFPERSPFVPNISSSSHDSETVGAEEGGLGSVVGAFMPRHNDSSFALTPSIILLHPSFTLSSYSIHVLIFSHGCHSYPFMVLPYVLI